MNPNYATPFETADTGGNSQFHVPDQVEFEVIDAKCEHYSTASGKSFAGLVITAKVGDEEYTEQLSAGVSEFTDVLDGKHFKPGPNSNFVPTKEDSQFKISKNFSAGIFQNSLLEVGFPWNAETWDEKGYTQLVGHKFLSARIPTLDKDGKQMKNSKGYPMTDLTVVKYVGSMNGKATTPGASAGAPGAGSDNVGDERKAEIEKHVKKLLDESGVMAKKDVLVAVKKQFDTAAMKLINTDWAKDAARPWTVEAGEFVAK